VAVIVIGPVIVAVHVHLNATVGVGVIAWTLAQGSSGFEVPTRSKDTSTIGILRNVRAAAITSTVGFPFTCTSTITGSTTSTFTFTFTFTSTFTFL
jgi:hypothetical protein